MPDADDVLIERFKNGDGAAFEKLFARHSGRIYGFVHRMCGHAEDAQDVLQETFLAAFRNLRGFRKEARLSTWLYKIASGICLKKRRRRKGEPKEMLSLENFLPAAGADRRPLEIPDWSQMADDRLYRQEIRRALDEAVRALPREFRIVLVLRDMEGLSAREAAGVLGISVAAVKSRLHRARLFVRERLGKVYENA